jgi:bifunctional non-homologous end joining protein LigD
VEEHKNGRRRAQPAWVTPMLATLSREVFSDPDWIFEPKLDGIRCLAFRKGNHLNLFSRNHLRLNDRYPELVAPLLKQRAQNFIVDGEVVALEGNISRFAILQRRMLSHVPVFYYIFDILYLDDRDLTQLPQTERKQILRRTFSFRDPLRFTEHRPGAGEKFYREACRKGWEGIIAKRAAGIYVHQRSRDWLKFKCENQQEFVIVGYTDPAGQRTGIGALLVGVYQRGKLLYAGKVGTGFDNATLKSLERTLSSIQQPATPCSSNSLPKSGVHWVKPRLVAQVAFTEWTNTGKLRHPRFLGLRTDKKASEVVRE